MNEATFPDEAGFFTCDNESAILPPIPGVLVPGGALFGRSGRTFPAYVSMARLAR